MMSLKVYQDKVDDWIREYGVRYFSELTNLGILTEELGELARLITRTYGDQSFKSEEQPKDIKDQIGGEMADMVFVLLCLANQMGIDLDHAFAMSIEKKTKRDADRHRNNPKLH